ncbi:hypothetical protein ebrios_20 [Escherichia phage Ebrios]|uniref:Uncharacterized protein n=1 Tax=Escherichia phage Ebrios TaxID=2099356 RepID=A0A2P1CKX1_9CAUD|nr:hypothetical protein HOS96_gp23 [Escherichia phage Ebrios]AVJ51903.1 hypothetical protein ebrios_20 [Escherichia phage Ebrios]
MSTMNIIKGFGRMVVRMYNREAARLNKVARAEATLARELAERSNKLSVSSMKNIDEAAKVASQAQELSKFFA